MTARLISVYVILIGFLGASPSARAQDRAAGATAADPRVSTADLALLLRPLSKSELAVEAEAWLKQLQRVVSDISRLQIAANRLEGDERNRKLTEVEKKREERTQLISRMLIVLNELERKGGQPDEYRTYVAAVQDTESGQVVDAPSPGKPRPPRTTGDTKIATGELTYKLRPMTLAELLIEAEGWQRLLQQSVLAISESEILGTRAQGAEKERQKSATAALRLTQAGIVERFKVVLGAVDGKGGKTDDYKTYINAVVDPDPTAKGGLVFPPVPKGPIPTTTGDIKVSTGDLGLMLTPLPKAQLQVEADGWLKLLQDAMQALTDAELGAAKATTQAVAGLREVAAQKREERTQITDRLKLVLDELVKKGGDRAPYDAYINAVSGIVVKTDDTGALVNAGWAWLKSPEGGLRYAKNAILFIITLILARIVTGIAGSLAARAMASTRGASALLKDFVVNTTRKVVFFVGFVIALSFLEVNIGPFLAAMGAVGFVIGFALQGTLSNFAAGVMILLYRPYDLHDTVTVAGVTGRVTAMTLVSTKVNNADGHEVVIPNSSIWGGTITNLSAAKPAKQG